MYEETKWFTILVTGFLVFIIIIGCFLQINKDSTAVEIQCLDNCFSYNTESIQDRCLDYCSQLYLNKNINSTCEVQNEKE